MPCAWRTSVRKRTDKDIAFDQGIVKVAIITEKSRLIQTLFILQKNLALCNAAEHETTLPLRDAGTFLLDQDIRRCDIRRMIHIPDNIVRFSPALLEAVDRIRISCTCRQRRFSCDGIHDIRSDGETDRILDAIDAI